MARARGDNVGGERTPEARQQKLPMFRRANLPAATPEPADDAATAAAEPAEPVALEPAEPVALEPAEPVALEPAEPAAPAVPEPATTPPPEGPATPEAAAHPEPVAAAAAARVAADKRDAAASPVARVAPAHPSSGLAANEPALPAAAAGGVGDLLLSARADSGYSIDEASSRTRIPRDVIEHLECNACDQLPPEYYCNAHIEKLSALYNIDPKPILERFHQDMLARRGTAEGLGHFHAVTTDSESGSRISYVLPGPGSGKATRAVSLTSAIVSGVLGLLLLIVVVALATQHFRHRQGDPATSPLPAMVGHTPPLDLKEFIVTEELNAYELPIPAK